MFSSKLPEPTVRGTLTLLGLWGLRLCLYAVLMGAAMMLGVAMAG